eukprot:TRINITY_DN30870_c0_g1_i2.p1 TRINITY_DN30870_c0_g1~~TRINITY_DN30870_c0_g1_i2.p1  ORF type:complete len:409 (-),score=20.47 TRINITY_DN30870_c0_g1_i2:155-1381(-)
MCVLTVVCTGKFFCFFFFQAEDGIRDHAQSRGLGDVYKRQGLNINPKGIYVDVTFGGGGHSQEILKNITAGRLIAFDQDEEAIQNRIEDDRFLLLNQNFRYLKNFLRLYNALPVDGIIADLGVSSHQIDSPERGFSTRFDGELDLRMDKRKKLTARYVVNKYTENQLKLLFSQYGEVRNASKLANTIIHFRNEKEINSTATLKEAMATCIDKRTENKYLAQVFQALRIEVNSEMDALKDLLIQAGEVLKPGGRLVVMSYHSLEDRLVKNFFKAGNFEGEVKKDFFGNPIVPFKLINRKPIVASQDELNENNRARSSKLRIAEKYQQMASSNILKEKQISEVTEPKKQVKKKTKTKFSVKVISFQRVIHSILDGTILTKKNLVKLLPFFSLCFFTGNYLHSQYLSLIHI